MKTNSRLLHLPCTNPEKQCVKDIMGSRGNDTSLLDIIGVVPMAGRATRLAGLPCSKEIHPVESHKGTHLGGKRPRAVCDYLFEKMHEAHIARVYVILRDGKWDIPAYLGDGSRAGVHLAYLMMGLPYGTPYSVIKLIPLCSMPS